MHTAASPTSRTRNTKGHSDYRHISSDTSALIAHISNFSPWDSNSPLHILRPLYHVSRKLGYTQNKTGVKSNLFSLPLLSHHASGENWSYGGNLSFSKANNCWLLVPSVCLLIQPILPKGHYRFFFSSLSSLLQHTRIGFACITIFLKGTHPGRLLWANLWKKKKRPIFCIFEKIMPPEGMGWERENGWWVW